MAGDVRRVLCTRAKLSARKNVAIGNSSFADKVKVYKESAYKTTNKLEKYQGTFGADEIKKRQAELAKWAVTTWPLTFE
ncbi:MAG TPA: HNH endonuclease family protein [Stellaceae bacterium]|jgi:hypothetical protein